MTFHYILNKNTNFYPKAQYKNLKINVVLKKISLYAFKIMNEFG